LPSLGGGGQGLREFFLEFYNDVARRAWLVLKNAGRARILNLCGRSIVVDEGLGFFNVQLAQI